MTYLASVEVEKPGYGTLPQVVERALRLRPKARILILRAGKAVLLVPEDPEIRRMVERNERILKERGITVNGVLRILRKQRRAAASHEAT